MKHRVGFGFDVHPLEEGRDLWLGGVKIPATRGATGHSDADVLIHALCDALLGAANLGDIGTHFPNTDPRWAGMDSKYFLQEVTRLINARGWTIQNADCTITLEAPRVRPHVDAMKKTLAPLMNISEDDVSIKATTNEKLGYIGRQEGINAYAVVLITSAR
jgi:2-C-methyl-D-erythritol 2,4-cyclodiphosphate synthase